MLNSFVAAEFTSSVSKRQVEEALVGLVEQWQLEVKSEEIGDCLMKHTIRGNSIAPAFQKSKEIAAGRIGECKGLIWEALKGAEKVGVLKVAKRIY